MSNTTPTYLAIDFETTGLDAETNYILEVAAVVLDEDLTEMGSYTSTISTYPSEQGTRHRPLSLRELCDKKPMDVYEMHRKSGLIDEFGNLTGAAVDLEQAEQALVKMVEIFPNKPILLGHSIHFDHELIEMHMEELAARLHYRRIDVRCFERIAEDLPWGRDDRDKIHRAEADVRYSITVARYARQWLRAGARPTSPSPLIQQRVVDMLYLYREDVSDRVRDMVNYIHEGDYAAAQAIAEHAEELEEAQPQLVYYLQGLRDGGAYPLQRAIELREQAVHQCESIRGQWMKSQQTIDNLKKEIEFTRRHLRDAQEEIDALRIAQGKV